MTGVLLFLAWTAKAAEPAGAEVVQGTFRPRPLLPWPVLELRGGGQGVPGGGNGVVCAEVGVWRYLAIEGCGTGEGFLYQTAGPTTEMVHFRAEGSLPVWSRGHAEVVIQPGLGFAEIERGGDEPGFLFGPARSASQREGAGPEATVGTKVRLWPHERFYLSGEVNAGAAMIPAARVVLDQEHVWVPSVTATVGVGF